MRHLPDAMPADAPDEGESDKELRVVLAGNGAGSVMSNPDGINCSTAVCSARFPHNSEVQLTAMSDNDSEFVGWSGACTGMQPTCKIDLAAARDVTATFALKKYTVTVMKAGAGSGTISGSGLACTSTCSIEVEHGASVSLSATPGSLSVFAGWGGACSGTGACTATITHDTTINANFALDDFTLFVSRGGTGTGTVTSSPSGITCGTDCDQTYTANQVVTLTAAPATSSNFTGWSGGGCSGTGTCTVTMTAARTVTATFTLKTFGLTVTKSGSGTVTGTGIACGTDCSHTYNYGTSVTLTANPATGYTFGGWSGACTGTGTCTVTMTAARSVTATFTANMYTLGVDRTGNGLGTITATGISCGTDCSESYAHGTSVTLTATPSNVAASLSTFGGWGGACSGTANTCTLSITAAASVTANFSLKPNIMFVTNNTYDGNVNGIAGADKRCTDAAGQAGLPGSYRAYLSSAIMGIAGPIPFHAPARFAGASGWIRTDGALVVKSINEFHSGMISNPPLLTEFGTSVANTQYRYVWTGTLQGQYASQCMPVGAWGIWNGTGNSAWAGNALATNTQAVSQDSFNCAGQMRLYCFGIDRDASPQ